MSKRFFVDDAVTDEGKYRVLQEDSETKERFGVNDFDTEAEAERSAGIMQRAADNLLSEKTTGDLPDISRYADDSDAAKGGKFKDTLQDIKDGGSQD